MSIAIRSIWYLRDPTIYHLRLRNRQPRLHLRSVLVEILLRLKIIIANEKMKKTELLSGNGLGKARLAATIAELQHRRNGEGEIRLRMAWMSCRDSWEGLKTIR